MTTYTVTYTNYKNEETDVLITHAESEKDAWAQADKAKYEYLNRPEQINLGQVTAISVGSEKWEASHPLLCK